MASQDRTTLRQDLVTSLRVLRLYQSSCPGLLPTLMGSALAEVALPFVNIIFPARILDCLLGARDIEELPRLILLAVGCNLIVNLMRQGLEQIRTLHDNRVRQMQEHYKIEKCLSMDYEHTENPESKSLIQRAEEGFGITGRSADHIREIGRLLQGGVTLVVALIVSGPMLFSERAADADAMGNLLNSSLAPVFLVLLLLGAAFTGMHLSSRVNQDVYEETQDVIKMNRLFGYLWRTMSDYRFGMEIRLYDMAPILKQTMKQRVRATHNYVYRVLQRTLGLYCLSEAIRSLTTGVIYLYVGLQALNGVIPVSGVVLYSGAIFQLNNGLTSLTDTLSRMRGRCLFLRLYLDFLDMPEVKPQGQAPVPHVGTTDAASPSCRQNEGPEETISRFHHEIEFRDVSFRYPGSSEYSLQQVSCRLDAGKTLAVVGMNGAGKTTFIKLLCRLYDPTEGAILLNGVDIREIDYQEYQKLFSVVFQDFKLMPFKVGENVAAAQNFDAPRVRQALRAAGIEDRVNAMPQQLNQHIYKDFDAAQGVEISGGEAQKIAIARAVYKDAAFVILDEPTAALDPIAEYEIYSSLAELVGQSTSIFISHRLSSCRFCHEIAVFHQGRLIQRGSHDDLLKDGKGKYAELWHAQAQYYE